MDAASPASRSSNQYCVRATALNRAGSRQGFVLILSPRGERISVVPLCVLSADGLRAILRRGRGGGEGVQAGVRGRLIGVSGATQFVAAFRCAAF
jgi:hypothetical protein